MTTLSQAIVEPIYRFLSGHPVQKAYVFGSFARGEEDQDSDIDILVELAPKVSLFEFVKIQIGLEEILRRKVDLVSSNGVSSHILPFIDADKVLIYEK